MNSKQLFIIMLIAGLGIVPTVIAIEYIIMPTFAKGGGCISGPAVNKALESSKGRCFQP